MQLVLLPASATAPFPTRVLGVLTVCGGCQPRPEEFYRVCSRTATAGVWPSETLASLPLPAEGRGDNGINIPVDSMSLGKEGRQEQSSNSWPEGERGRLGRESSLCHYKRRLRPQRPFQGGSDEIRTSSQVQGNDSCRKRSERLWRNRAIGSRPNLEQEAQSN